MINLLKPNKMKKILLILILSISTLILHSQDLNIINDTIWNSDTININANVCVYPEATLTILPGTTVEFEGQYMIKIYGKLMALGNINDSIKFTINDTTFLSDTSTILGGWKGIHLLNNNNDTSIFKYCILEYGKAVKPGIQWYNTSDPENYGGAIYINNYNCVSISNSAFRYNFARDKGGAIYADTLSCLKIDSSEFYMNIVKHEGGAIYAGKIDNVLISNNTFLWNEGFMCRVAGGWTTWSGAGGAILLCNPLGNSKAYIINNKFFNNKAVSGVIYDAYPHTYMYNNILCNNQSITYLCGSPYCHSIFSNNVVANNFYLISTAGIACYSNHTTIANSIIWNNQTLFPNDQEQITSRDYIPIVKCNCVMDGYQGNHGGNIDDNPMFVNPSPREGREYEGKLYNWNLKESSPCINAGTPDTSGLFLPALDFESNTRVYGTRVDMGAYENQNLWVKINDSPVFASKINIYPNPAIDKLIISIPPDFLNSKIEIYDQNARLIRSSILKASPSVILVSDLKPGFYFYKIYNSKKGIIKTGKCIKR